MATDFFRNLDLHNRKIFSQKGREGKTYRLRLLSKTLEVEKDLRNILPSNYLSSITGPNYTIALRAYAIEFARIRLAIEDLQNDSYFASTTYGSDRADLAYQKLGSLLALDKDLKLSIFSSQEFCQFVLSLVEIFFGGSTPANIKSGIETFVGESNVVTISENFLDARDPFSAYDISDQFGFRVDFELTDNISQHFQDINIKLDFLLKLIKPAHTLFLLRFIFTDLIEFLLEADDTVLSENMWDHTYDDLRVYWEGVSGRDRLGVNTPISVTEDFSSMEGDTIYPTYGPLSKNQTLPEIADTTDVTVLVDGVTVTVSAISVSAITLATPVTVNQSVSVSYYYWKNVDFQFTIGDPNKILGPPTQTKYPVRWVLNNTHATHPRQTTWSYGGFEKNYTALIGDPGTLLIGEPPNKISDANGRIYGHRHVLNWSNYVRSPDQVDISGYTHVLNEDTPIVEIRHAYNTVYEYRKITSSSKIGWGEQAWGSFWGGIDFVTGTIYEWAVVHPGGHFVDPLDVTSTNNTGETDLIHPAYDNDMVSMSIDSGLEDTYTFPSSIYSDYSGLFIANVSSPNGTDLLNNFAGVAGYELTQSLVMVTPYEDVYDIVSGMSDNDPEVSTSQEEGRGDSYDYTGFFVVNTSSPNSSDVLWDNEQLGHWSDEGYIMIVLGVVTSHLASYEKDTTTGAP